MTAPEYDPIEADNPATVDFMVERTLAEVDKAMLPVRVEFLRGDNAEARRLLADIHTKLTAMNPALLARCITDLLDTRQARDNAARWLGEMDGGLDLMRDLADMWPGQCPDPHLHRVWDVQAGRTEASVLREARGCCPWCSNQVVKP
jgi:hypothetical protein